MTVLPNFIIAGVNKAGTTSIFSYLASHPEVTGSSVKETCYFLPVRYGKPIDRFDDYLSLFDQNSSAPIVMEATPGYFYGGEALAKEIDSSLPSARIVVVFRDPASRLISFFNFMKSMLLIDQSMQFSDYVSRCQGMLPSDLKIEANNPYFGVQGGYYSNYLSAWQNQFGDRLKIVFFEDLKNNPRKTMIALCQWMGIDKGFYDEFDFSVENKTSRFRMKHLHRLALSVNRNFERIFRKFPQLKSGLRALYARLNLSNKQSTVDQGDRDLAESLYQDSNRELRGILQKDPATAIPSWLRVT